MSQQSFSLPSFGCGGKSVCWIQNESGFAVVCIVLLTLVCVCVCVLQARVTYWLPQDKAVQPQDVMGLATSEDLAMGPTTR